MQMTFSTITSSLKFVRTQKIEFQLLQRFHRLILALAAFFRFAQIVLVPASISNAADSPDLQGDPEKPTIENPDSAELLQRSDEVIQKLQRLIRVHGGRSKMIDLQHRSRSFELDGPVSLMANSAVWQWILERIFVTCGFHSWRY